MATKGAAGGGTIRKKTVMRGGKEYTYWEARVTVGRDPGTGKQKQKSITGKTQKEVRQKLQELTMAVNEGTYQEPCKMTLSSWLDIWAAEYLSGVKPRTVDSYKSTIKNHLKPSLGAVRLQDLQPHQIQTFCNALIKDGRSAKTVKNIHGVLHAALHQAASLGYIRFNPADTCKLPRIERPEIKPLDGDQISAFLSAIRGHRYERLFIVTLFTGMREGEVLGLTWDCVDFNSGTILVKQQLQKERGSGGVYHLLSTKNGKSRRISPAPSVMEILKTERTHQKQMQLRAGPLWDNSMNLVFTNEIGKNFCPQTVYLNFKRVAAKIGIPSSRFHDLRHSYAVSALRAGDDIKTVQETLGHHTAAFTLDVYGHVTDQMRKESANRMEQVFQAARNA